MGQQDNAGPLVDPLRMQDLAGVLGDDLQELIDAYLVETNQMLRAMREAFSCGDQREVARLAHSLRSSSGIFGAQEVVSLCSQLEDQADMGTAGENLLQSVQAAFDRVRAVLHLYR